MYAKNIRPSAKRGVQTERNVTNESRALGELKFSGFFIVFCDFQETLNKFYAGLKDKGPRRVSM